MSTLSQSLADLRQSYERAELGENASHPDPFRQFEQWLQEALAAQVPEPNAMTLATVGADLRPSTRVVLIKDFDARGLVWFTNYQSRKGQELAGNPFAALQFHWVALERVVRIEGVVEKVDTALSDEYFARRPLLSRLAAIASPQSQVVANRAALEAQMAASTAQENEYPQRPAHWGGYRLVPNYFEFWQGRRNRLHDRLRYESTAATGHQDTKHQSLWIRSRLAP
jgi:pyridoxamine 5'-phosphate oxidase